jgi:hypothetical protein
MLAEVEPVETGFDRLSLPKTGFEKLSLRRPGINYSCS